MSKSNKRPPIVFIVGVLLVCLTLVSVSMTSGLYARYTTTASGSDAARVAKFEITTDLVDKATTLTLTGLQPGHTQEIKLKVENKSEVSVRYKFDIQSLDNLPLEFSFDPDNGAGQLLLGGAQQAEHTLTVTWPMDQKAAEFVSEIDLVTVVLTCTQVD